MDSQKIIKNEYASKLKKNTDETYLPEYNKHISKSPCEGLTSSDAQEKKERFYFTLCSKRLFATDQEFQILTIPLVSTIYCGAITGCYSRNDLQMWYS